MYKIPLIRSAFYRENETLEKLSSFIHDLSFIEKKQLSMGELCKQFEIEFAKWQKRKYAVLVNCLTEDTMIMKSNNKPVYLKELKKNDEIISMDIDIYKKNKYYIKEKFIKNKIKNIYNTGEQEVFILKTRNREIKATANHKFCVINKMNNKKQYQFSWKKLKELNINDIVILAKNFINLENNNLIDLCIPINNELMYLFGLFLGDGWMSFKQNKKYIVSFAFGDEKEKNNYEKLIKDVFKYTIKINKKYRQAHIYSKNIYNIFKKAGFGEKSLTKTIPDWIWNINNDLKESFLKGYLEADGHKIKNRKYSFSIVTPNRKLLEEIKIFSEGLGYRTCNLYKRKIQKDLFICGKKVKKINQSYSLEISKSLNKGNIKYGRYNEIPIQAIRDLKYLGINKIKKIESIGVQQTYDIEMEKEPYNFIANGLLVHNSGASANLLLLQSLKNMGILKAGDNIGFSALTWATNVMPIIQMGFNPIPIDCETSTLNIDIIDLKNKIKDFECLFVTNALGLCSDMLQIKLLCSQNNVLLLEDNAESQGTEFDNIKTGNFGLASTFSFFVGHIMSTIEGGMICTDDYDLYNNLLMTRANGWDRNLSVKKQNSLRKKNNIDAFKAKYTFFDLAFNMRPTEIIGFLGLEQLKYIDEIIGKRQNNFNHFMMVYLENDDFIPIDNLNSLSKVASFALPIICRAKKLKDKYLHKLEKAGIETRPMIAGDITLQPFWKKYINKEYNLEGCKFLDECSFYIGNNPLLTEKDLQTIIDCIR